MEQFAAISRGRKQDLADGGGPERLAAFLLPNNIFPLFFRKQRQVVKGNINFRFSYSSGVGLIRVLRL